MGPVREDRNVDNALAVVLQVWLAQDSPELTFRIEELHNSSAYWRVETIEWPLRLFPVRTLADDGYIVFPDEQGFTDSLPLRPGGILPLSQLGVGADCRLGVR